MIPADSPFTRHAGVHSRTANKTRFSWEYSYASSVFLMDHSQDIIDQQKIWESPTHDSRKFPVLLATRESTPAQRTKRVFLGSILMPALSF